jgi:hypothetical protein
MNDLDFGGPFSGDFEEVFVFNVGLAGGILELIFAAPGVFLKGEFGCEPLARAPEDEDLSFFFFIFFLFSFSIKTPPSIRFGYE